MTCSTLLLHLDGGTRQETTAHLALRLASTLPARIVAVSAAGIPSQSGATLLPYGSGLPDPVWADLRMAAQQRARRFEVAAAAHAGIETEVVVDDDDEVVALSRHARCSDLVILGQPDPRGERYREERLLVERVLLDSAPPCLLVPYAGDFPAVGRHVLVAWNDSRSCSRAILAALPVLRKATLVRLVQCDLPATAGGASSHPRLEAASRWLEHHGVPVRASVETTEIDFANALLSRASDFGVDLIVAGGWSHSRLGEQLFGGVTRTLLDSMTVPTLMTH